jgi:hypothetical protein
MAAGTADCEGEGMILLSTSGESELLQANNATEKTSAVPNIIFFMMFLFAGALLSVCCSIAVFKNN